MANTYTRLVVQYVFVVKYREAVITEAIRDPLEKYITGIVQRKEHKMLAIYCMPDHTHILIGLNPNQSIADLARDINANSSKWLNEQRYFKKQFRWQRGYAAFSYSKREEYILIRYILNQQKHHSKKTFKDEYLKTLERFEIDYNPDYLFHAPRIKPSPPCFLSSS